MTFLFRKYFNLIVFSLFICVVALHSYDFFYFKKNENNIELPKIVDVVKSITSNITIRNKDNIGNALQNNEDRISVLGEISEQDISAIKTNLENLGWKIYLKTHQGKTPSDLTSREIFCKQDDNSEIVLIIDKNNVSQPVVDLTGYASSRLCPKFGASLSMKITKHILQFSLVGALVLAMLIGKIVV